MIEALAPIGLHHERQNFVKIVKAENGYLVHVSRGQNEANPANFLGEIMGSFGEGGDPISAIKKMASKQELLQKTKQKAEELYVAKNAEELLALLKDVITTI